MSAEKLKWLRQAGSVRYYAVGAALLWTLLAAVSVAWNIVHQREEVLFNAHLQADAYINKDLSFRSWVTAHGGVYVRPDEKTPPNPYLKVPDRDVVTTNGVKLTLMNPAYVMRQVLGDYSEAYGLKGHITSLKLLNPGNAPDPWEHEALLAFEKGAQEMQTIEERDGKRYFRHMRPILVQQGCLKCHGEMGYKVGEVRGGISTTMELAPLETAASRTVQTILITHGLTWLLGLLGIILSARHFSLREAEREHNLEEGQRNEQRALALLALDDKADKLDEKTLLQEGLEEAERLTGSQIAFLHYINDDQQTIQLVTWSRRTKEHCRAAFDDHYPIAKAGVWADCVRLRQPVVHNDYQSLSNKHGYPQGHSHLLREAVVPVLEGDKVRLIMGVGNKPSDYDPADVRLLQMIANGLWKVVVRRRAEEALRRANEEMEQRVRERTRELSVANDSLSGTVSELQSHQREMRLINQLNDLLQSCQTEDEAYRVMAVSLRELFREHDGMLTAMDASRQFLEKVVSWGSPDCDESFAPDACWAMRQGHTHWVRDVNKDLLCQHFSRVPPGGYLCLPLIAHGEIMGMLHIEVRGDGGGLGGESLRNLAVTVGESIKLGLSNIRLRAALREQATHDQLTGLYNRRYLDETLPREMHRAMRGHAPLCVVMLDIDHFKAFNDTYGHEAGDVVLRELGWLLRSNLRKSDVAVRYGGEEIAIVMPDSTLEDARLRVEELRRKIGELELRFEATALGRITISAGVAAMDGPDQTPEQLLRTADQVLYAAKMAGRDRVMAYQQK